MNLMEFAEGDICRYICINCRDMVLDTVDFESERDTVVKWLGIQSPLPTRSNAAFVYIELIRGGLKSGAVNLFIKHSRLTQKQVARMIHVSERTLQRNTPEKPMDSASSERLIELTRFFHKGIRVFGDQSKFTAWLHRPNVSLNNQLPLVLIETNLGMDLVVDELLKIEHGVFA